MENEIDEFDEEVEDLEEDEEEVKPVKKKSKVVVKEPEVPLERYTAFYQEPRMGIIDTITKEVIVEGMTDLALAKLEAFKLNKLDKIETVTGVD